MSISHWVGTWISDFRYALRTLRRSPGFVAVAAMTLALGIGANTAIFSLLDQILLRLLPVKNPQQLVLLTMRGHHYGNNWGGNAISHPMFRDFQAHNEVFSGMFCRFPNSVSLTFGGQSERVHAELVSGTYFSILGVNTILGRAFTLEDDRVPLGHPLVMLTYEYWRQRFGGDSGIVGKNLIVNGHNMTVAGVVQPGFDGVELGYTPKVFIPIMMQDWIIVQNPKMLTDRRTRWVNAFGRLKPGVTATQAKASLQPFMHSMLEMEVKEAAFNRASTYDREQFLKSWIDVLPGSQGRSYTRRELSTPLWVLMGTTGMVLLIACANLANLLLARAVGRQKEIAVRLAVGASRWRLLRQLLTESLLLSAAGGLLGLVAAWGTLRTMVPILMARLPQEVQSITLNPNPDIRIVLYSLCLAFVTGIGFGLIPALQG